MFGSCSRCLARQLPAITWVVGGMRGMDFGWFASHRTQFCYAPVSCIAFCACSLEKIWCPPCQGFCVFCPARAARPTSHADMVQMFNFYCQGLAYEKSVANIASAVSSSLIRQFATSIASFGYGTLPNACVSSSMILGDGFVASFHVLER